MNRLEAYKADIIRLCETHKVKSLYAFGSVLTDNFNKESDIDLIVDFSNIAVEDYADNYFDFKFSLQDILKRPIDLLEEQAIKNPYFRQTVNQQRQLVYSHFTSRNPSIIGRVEMFYKQKRGHKRQSIMSKKRNGKTEFVKWFGPVLDALRALGGSATPKEITEWIGEAFNVPDEILNERYEKSGVLKFPNQLAWARQYLVWEELLATSKRGVWALSPKGWETILDIKKSHEIFLKWVKIQAGLREGKDSENEVEEIIANQEENEPDSTNTKLNLSLIEVLQNLSPTGFEHLCGRLLREYNFENIEISQQSHDGGIDGYATLKLNPFVNMSVYFQCKRYTGTVPTEKVQAFIGVMETNKRSVEKGLLITTGSFAKAALDIEKNNIKLELIDGEKLVKMFEEVELGVKPKTIYEPDMIFFEHYREKK